MLISLNSFMMRAFLLPLALLPFLASAQVPNGGFESWVDQGGNLDPVGWLTYNEVQTEGGATVEQGTPGNPGGVHVVITSRPSLGGGLPIQGWISAGASGTNAGFPYASRPAMLTGQWQYGIQPNDTGVVTVALSKWNDLSSSTDVIAIGMIEVQGALSTWQSFSVPLEYSSSNMPDTAYIQIVSSINFASPVVGSFMKVDDLAFVGTVGMDAVNDRSGIDLFPNPGTTYITLTLPPGRHNITLFDATGRVVLGQRTTEERPVIRTDALPTGPYLITVRDEEGGTIRAMWVKE